MKKLFHKTLSLAACLAAALSLLASAATVQAATMVSDKDDYSPGETVYLLGTGFWAGEAVVITLAVHTEDGTILDYAIGGIYADAEGSIVATWLVPQEALDTWIEATAIGDQSALVAVATFTDSSHQPHNVNFATVGLPAGVSITVSWSKTNPPGNSASDSTTFNSPGPSVAEGTKASTSFTYSGFPALVAGIGGDYVLQTTSPASPFTTGTAGNSTTVTATYSFVPEETVECPENQAPTISASNLDLGKVVGCLVDGSFQITVNIAASDFNPVTVDPDGDSVTVTVNVNSVTLIGPGDAEVEVTLTATDDPSGRNVDGCPELEAQSTSTKVKVMAKVVYDFIGFASPLDNNTARKVKNGSTVPVKFRLTDCNGTEICSTPTPNWIWVGCQSEYAPEGGVEVDDSGAANDNDVNFRYSGTCGDGTWIYNLSTKTGYSVGKMYKITAILADGTTHDVMISINK